MASTVTTYGNSVRVIKVAWTSDGSGDATGAVFIDGELKRMTTDPGSTAPTSKPRVNSHQWHVPTTALRSLSTHLASGVAHSTGTCGQRLASNRLQSE
jgi:hypothetical protein